MSLLSLSSSMGLSPVTTSRTTAPKLNTSTLTLTSPLIASGAMY